ncbi:MAG: N-acetyl-gamma-glutamyl-phosphate reductase [Janthinobacterium lividum]
MSTLALTGDSVRTAVAGVTGYAGAELARLLLNHPRLSGTPPLFLGRMDAATDGTTLYDLHPQLARNGAVAPLVMPFTWETLRESSTEILFLATPHEQSREWAPLALEAGMRVIDLSGAWRLHEPANAAVYKLQDADATGAAALQAEAVYGCPELHRDRIAQARLVANPGCYATSVILALAPLLQAGIVDLERGIVCDAKSGVSGAGKAATAKTHFMYAADNLSAYAVFGHRHTGELLEQLHLASDQIQFTPHLLPIPRGILSTMYLRLKEPSSYAAVEQIFRGFYEGSPMVRVHRAGDLPQIQHVVRSSFCDIGFELGPDGKRMVLVSCLDNLLKGAASQAVQNMNVMCGWNESEGLL